MNLNVFKLRLVFSIFSVFFLWSIQAKGVTRFFYFGNSEKGTFGVCIMEEGEHKYCENLTSFIDFKQATNIAAHNNFLYLTNYNNMVKVYNINKRTGRLYWTQKMSGFDNPTGIEFWDNKILITNYNVMWSGLNIISLNQDEQLKGLLNHSPGNWFWPFYNYYYYTSNTYYPHSIKFYTPPYTFHSSRTIAYLTNYTDTAVSTTTTEGAKVVINKALVQCDVDKHFSKSKGYLRWCRPVLVASDTKFEYPEKIFIHNDILYTTSSINGKFTYSKININYPYFLENINLIKFNDDFKVNFVDFHDNYAYLASAENKIRKCKLQPDGGIAPDCNTELDFVRIRFVDETFDFVKFVDVNE